MAKWWCLLAKKTTCFGLYRPSSGSDNFLLKEFYIICLNRVVMLRSHHHSACYCWAKLVGCQWICRWLGMNVDVDLIGWVDVGLGGTYGCRCGVLYTPMLGVIFYDDLFSMTSSFSSLCFPCSSELIGGAFSGLPPGFCYVCVCVGMAHLLYGSGYLVSFFCFLGVWGFSLLVCVRVAFFLLCCALQLVSLVLGSLYFLWLLIRLCVVFGALSSWFLHYVNFFTVSDIHCLYCCVWTCDNFQYGGFLYCRVSPPGVEFKNSGFPIFGDPCTIMAYTCTTLPLHTIHHLWHRY